MIKKEYFKTREDGVVYLCMMDSNTVLSHNLGDLIGLCVIKT